MADMTDISCTVVYAPAPAACVSGFRSHRTSVVIVTPGGYTVF